jgi:hypothetical protein
LIGGISSLGPERSDGAVSLLIARFIEVAMRFWGRPFDLSAVGFSNCFSPPADRVLIRDSGAASGKFSSGD